MDAVTLVGNRILATFAVRNIIDSEISFKLNMNKFHKINNLFGWSVFLLSALVYFLTIEPTVSLWDCGEYISTAFKLQVGHPPGAPLFQLLGRIFSLAAPDVSSVAFLINLMSALASSFTVLFLFWSISMLGLRTLRKSPEMLSQTEIAVLMASGFVGSLAYAFTDSFWFSAVEGEVYALSSFFTAVVFWAILKWERRSHEDHSSRWLILIAYLMGLSIGVHLLNLLAIPAITLIYFYKRQDKTKLLHIAMALLVSVLLIATVMYLIIPEVVSLFALSELLFVNNLNLPFHTGTLFFTLLLALFIIAGLLYTIRNSSVWIRIFAIAGMVISTLYLVDATSTSGFLLRIAVVSAISYLIFRNRHNRAQIHNALLAFTFILIGYSSFLVLVIRANAGTPINENSPKDAISLLSYLNREQYGDWPLLYGPYYNSEPTGYESGKPVYARNDLTGKYEIIHKNQYSKAKYNSGECTVFPRMYENIQPEHAQEYKIWTGADTKDQNYKPTFSDNLKFFFRYQINHMYFRYFMWNFSGKQNDIQGYSDRADGNWITGFNFIDTQRVGHLTTLATVPNNKGENRYYLLPLLLGLAGMIFHFSKSRNDGLVVLSLFFMTGLAIVIYLNQYSPQPRERDYAYAASFYAFAIWIGIGVLALVHLLKKLTKPWVAVTLGTIAGLSVPTLLLSENYDDHDRSGRYAAAQIAKAYLDSCEPDAILFTVGDNDTFPLWYMQEVENYRTDVRVCNLSLLGMDWYIDQMKTKVYESEPVPFTLSHDQYRTGTRDIVYLVEQEGLRGVDLGELFHVLQTNETLLQQEEANGYTTYFFPATVFGIAVDNATISRSDLLSSSKEIEPEKQLVWKISQSAIQKNDLMVMDLLAHYDWTRPVYITAPTASPVFEGLRDYFRLEGLAYRLTPFRDTITDNQTGYINSDILYNRLMKQFSVKMNDTTLYYNDDYLRYGTNLRNIYYRLANRLLLEKQHEKAISVCDTALNFFPTRVVPYDYFTLEIAGVYYEAGATQKGDELIKPILNDLIARLNWFEEQPRRVTKQNDMNIRQLMSLLNHTNQILQSENRTELSATSSSELQRFYENYVRRNPKLQ